MTEHANVQPELIVVALGGNAIKGAKEKGTYEEQLRNVSITTTAIADIIDRGYEVVVTHGNGPQVGNILIQQALGASAVPAMPMDVCGAESQGLIGYLIQNCLDRELRRRGKANTVATIVTQVAVAADDPAFEHPTKPVGPFYTREEAEPMIAQGMHIIEDSGRGYRRVVPSPQPRHIVEIAAVRTLAESGAIVVASGGGGIPVVETAHGYDGVEAVIDKDLAGQLLAREVGADYLLILTDVEFAALNYKTTEQKNLGELTLDEARRYADEGHFAKGSMGPKVRAAISFVENGGKRAIITDIAHAMQALDGQTGTQIRAEG